MPLRFAPSPSGYLHVGNARTAVMNWILSKQSGESFLLRLDDTDEEKSKETFSSSGCRVFYKKLWQSIVCSQCQLFIIR